MSGGGGHGGGGGDHHDPLEGRLHDDTRHLDLDHLLEAYDKVIHPDAVGAAKREGTKLISSLYDATKQHLAGAQGMAESTHAADLKHLGYKNLPGLNEAQRHSMVDDLLKRWYIAGKAHELGKSYADMEHRISAVFDGVSAQDQLRDIKSYLNQKMFTPETVRKLQQMGHSIKDAEGLVSYLANHEDVIGEILGEDSVIKRLFSAYVSSLDKRSSTENELFTKMAKAAYDDFGHFRDHLNHELGEHGLELQNLPTPEAAQAGLLMRRHLKHPDAYGLPNDPRVYGQFGEYIKKVPKAGGHGHSPAHH